MIFNLLNTRREETTDTGTFADGIFDLSEIEIKTAPRRLRGHIAHQRDYGSDRTVAQLPAGFA
ncbi:MULTISPECIES: hypothetical protein [unclassified Rhizobium]|uniref:hypothetical protein n=1 Tax=unclassified Rhizobium TaxID=2613769 RepID=UPI000713E5BA|nr:MULTISPECIES: hypothetical protein [unclassified Rhizobium]KQS90357.1 hypothetical protein ASG50_07850 [Rhizobium sp. Leaf386]KQS90737.1 hypothetical protein ASG42_09430 [Rhizobium sp. Leaf391]KQU10098.1 hypothetical protein ASG68_03720 [Rhizobium sp. Leaf453]